MAEKSNASVRERVKGLVAPIPAVFDGKGEPDLPMMERLTDWYLGAGVHGFFVLGSQGQGPACRIDQRKARYRRSRGDAPFHANQHPGQHQS